MVDRNIIIKAFDMVLDNKCGPTISDMHSLLDSWSRDEKRALIKYGVPFVEGEGFDIYNPTERKLEVYDSILENGTDDEIFDYERKIFDNLSKKQRDNILEYLVGFDEDTFIEDYTGDYPFYGFGENERRQVTEQEKYGYSPEIQEALYRWTHGYFGAINRYVFDKSFSDSTTKRGPLVMDMIKRDANSIMNYINESHGLTEDTVLWRGGHWDIGMKVGDVGEIPLLNATSYNEDTAYNVGIDDREKKNPYMIKIFAPTGTKGVHVNAPSLEEQFPEHEYLLGKGQKYIVVDVDDNKRTASILLLN